MANCGSNKLARIILTGSPGFILSEIMYSGYIFISVSCGTFATIGA